jgi:hypothetical protein
VTQKLKKILEVFAGKIHHLIEISPRKTPTWRSSCEEESNKLIRSFVFFLAIYGQFSTQRKAILQVQEI